MTYDHSWAYRAALCAHRRAKLGHIDFSAAMDKGDRVAALKINSRDKRERETALILEDMANAQLDLDANQFPSDQ